MAITLYDNPLSGHAHRPRALLKLLGVDYDETIVNLPKGEHKSPDFLKLNPLGQIPVLTDGDLVLRDSTAILVYIASKFDDARTWLPTNPELAAQVQQWLAVSTKEIYLGPCAARISKLFGAPFDHGQAVEKANALFATIFEPHLADRDWLAGDGPTIADIANYGYIAAAHEGEIDLAPYPHTSAWLARLEALPGFVPMPKAADILAAA